MFAINDVVFAFFFLLGIAAIFGAMFWLIGYIERKIPCEVPIYNGIRIFLAVAAVAVFICWVLALFGHPIVRFR